MNVASRRKGYPPPEYSDDDLLSLLRECAQELDRTPGTAAYDVWAGFSASQLFALRFGSWRKACMAAGLVPHPSPPRGFGERKYSDADIRAAYARISLLVVDPPTIAEWGELREPWEPTAHCLRQRHQNKWMNFLAWAGA